MKLRLFNLILILLFISGYHKISAGEYRVGPDSNYSIVKNLIYYDTLSVQLDDYMKERCRLDIYYPSDTEDFPTVVWFHGGGLKTGEKYIPDPLMSAGIAVVAVNYRLYPKISSPEYIKDAAASVAWVLKNIRNYGGDPKQIFISGHSAGGYLASMLGLDKRWLKEFNIDPDSIAGIIPFSGHTITHFTVREERGIPGTQPIIDDLAPLYHVRADAPPMVLLTGDRELELLGRYEENAYLMRMLKVTGNKMVRLHELQGFDHGSMVEPACFILLNYIRERMNNSLPIR